MASEQDSEIVFALNKGHSIMYIGISSTYLNYKDFKRPVGGAMKLSRACFRCFEFNSSLLWLDNCNWR